MRQGSGTKRGYSHPGSVLALSLMAVALYCLMPAGNTVWATPPSNRLRQTIPTLTPTPVPSWTWIGRAGGNPVDYAASGMPDFDQKQADWHHSEETSTWTHCAPVAVADALWWLDSVSELGGVAPPQTSDGYELVGSYGSWDDHDPKNVAPLVSDLASRMSTQTDGERPGTSILSLAPALQAYIAEKGLQDSHEATLIVSPTFEQLRSWVQRGDGVVLLLGFWEYQGDRWVYLGGHYVAVAGTEPLNRYVGVCDPFRDAWEAGEALLGRTPVHHDYPHSADLHNDAQYVSQDAYRTVDGQGPGGAITLEGYVPAFSGVPNFVGQNVPTAFESYLGPFGGSPVITTKVDFAIRVSRPVTLHHLFLPLIWKGAN